MNKFIYFVVFFLISIHCHGQTSDIEISHLEGFSVGIEKNNSIWTSYGFRNGIHINFKHTAIADELSKQSWRISALFAKELKVVQAIAAPFVTSDWYTSFYNVGMSIRIRNTWKDDVVKIGIEYIPFHDNDLKFQNGWAVGLEKRLYKQTSLFLEYGRKPDFRIAYERLFVGFDIIAKDLCVKPMIVIPSYDSGIRWNHSKVVVSMSYIL